MMSLSALRIWFRVFGVLYLLGGIGQVINAFSEPGKSITSLIVGAVMIAFSVSYLYVSKKFPLFLQTSTLFVQRLLYFTMAFSLMLIPILYTAERQPDAGIPVPVLFVIFWVLVPLYLLYNVKRIEEEHILEDD